MSRRRRPPSRQSNFGDSVRYSVAKARYRQLEAFYANNLRELAINRFEWTGLPEDSDFRPRYIEQVLLNHGCVAFFRDDSFAKYLCIQATPSGVQDMYYDPTKYTLVATTAGLNGRSIPADDCVPIWCNRMRIPQAEAINIYAEKLANIDRTIEINVVGLRHPFLIATDEDSRLSASNMYRMIAEGEPLISVRKSAMGESIADSLSVLDMRIDKDLLGNLLLDKRRILMEVLTYLGINNANQDKRERLVAAEVTANDEEILTYRNTVLNSRREACDEINRRYGLNIGCQWDSSVDAISAIMMDTLGGGNVDVHDDDSESD